MAGSVNKVILVGNLGADPVVRATQDGREMVMPAVSVGRRWSLSHALKLLASV